MELPKITVLLPVYNGAKYLPDCLESILCQSYPNFELLIINDGSTDQTEQLVQNYSDERIRYLKNEGNKGLIYTLNKGIQHIQTKYIARIDADDRCHPARLEKQFAFMESHPEYVICGSYIETFGENQENRLVKYQTEDPQIRFRLLFDCHLAHPTVFLRTATLKEHKLCYNPKYLHTEDFELWHRLLNYGKIKILPEVLTQRRTHEAQICSLYPEIQTKFSQKIRKNSIEKIAGTVSDKVFLLYENILRGKIPSKEKEIFLLLDFLEQIILSKQKAGSAEKKIINTHFLEIYQQIATQSTHLGMKIHRRYRRWVQKIGYSKESRAAKLRFWIKCVLKYRYNKPNVFPTIDWRSP